MEISNQLLGVYWQRKFPNIWLFGLLLIFLWGIPRFFLVLQANASGNYQWVSLIFVSMWFTPWVFLSKAGRQKMGLKKPKQIAWIFYGLALGLIACAIMYMVANWLYGHSISNWFVYISNSYSNLPAELSSSDKWIYFSIYAVISMTFSPIGEEFFYRGVIHECFATQWGDKTASIIDSLAFSITHLAHFGIVYQFEQWDFLIIPAAIWVVLLFLICRIFFLARQRSRSILGAIFAHAGFNLAMIYIIFFYVL